MPMSSMPEESEDGPGEDAVELDNDEEHLLEDDVAQIDEEEDGEQDGAQIQEPGELEAVSTLSARASEDPDTGPQERHGVLEDAASPDHGLKRDLIAHAEDSPSIPDDTPSIQVCSALNTIKTELTSSGLDSVVSWELYTSFGLSS